MSPKNSPSQFTKVQDKRGERPAEIKEAPMADDAQVQIQLPPGMSKEDFEKAFNSFQKNRIATQVRDKAARNAAKALQNKYPDEYAAMLEAEMKKVQAEMAKKG